MFVDFHKDLDINWSLFSVSKECKIKKLKDSLQYKHLKLIIIFYYFFFQTELLYWPRPIVAFPWDQHDPSWLCNLFLWMHLSANITTAKSGLSYGHFTFRSTSHTH